MKEKKKQFLAIVLVLIFFLIGCTDEVHKITKDTSERNNYVELKKQKLKDKDQNLIWTSFSNTYYRISYPINWKAPKRVTHDRFKDYIIRFLPEGRKKLEFEIITLRLVNETGIEYTENRICKESEDCFRLRLEIEEAVIGDVSGHKITVDEESERLIYYVAEKNGLIFQLKYRCKTYEYKFNEAIIKKLNNSFEFYQFKSIGDIKETWNKYSSENIEVYYPDNSPIGDWIEEWIKERIDTFNYIVDYLGVEWNYEPIKFFVFNNYKQQEEYGLYCFLAGSFVKFLIDKYGLDRFKEFFTQEEFNEEDSFKFFYGKSGEILIEEWKDYLKEYDGEETLSTD